MVLLFYKKTSAKINGFINCNYETLYCLFRLFLRTLEPFQGYPRNCYDNIF